MAKRAIIARFRSSWVLLTSALLLGGAGPDGAAIFAARCAPCHQADATGADGLAPSLAGTLKDYLKSADGTQYLSQIAVSGMAGRIESQGRVIVGIMPSFKADSSDADVAAVLNYVLGHFNGAANADAGAPITVAAVAASRAAAPTPAGTRKLREKIKAASP